MDKPAPLIVVCDWLPPSYGAVGQYMDQRARAVANAGGTVVLIGLGEGAASETVEAVGDGVLTTVRLPAPVTPKQSLVGRALWTLKQNWMLTRATGQAQKRLDGCTLLVTGSPPFLSTFLILMNRLFWRRRLIYRIYDFYPEVAFAAGKARWLKPLKPFFELVRRMADEIEASGSDQKRRLVESGIAPERITELRDGAPVSITGRETPLERPFPDDKLILLYSGNLGVAHEIETFCEGYRRHVQEGSDTVRVWMNGTGKIPALKAYCDAHSLPLHLTPPRPIGELANLMMTADAHLVLLGDGFWGYVIPSKIYACLDSGRPVVFVGPEESDVYDLTRKRGGLFHARQGDADEVFRQLEALSATHGQTRHG